MSFIGVFILISGISGCFFARVGVYFVIDGVCTSSGILFDCRAKLGGLFKVVFVIVYCCHFLAYVRVRVCIRVRVYA